MIKAWGFIRLSPIYFLTNFYSAICKSLVPDSRSNLHISLKSLNKRDAFKDTKSSFRVLSSPLKQRRLWKAPCIAWAVVYKSEKEAANSPNETCACCCSARSRSKALQNFLKFHGWFYSRTSFALRQAVSW